MTREEEKQLAYREERAEAAMFHICRDLYEIDVPNHPVKDGYRIGFNEGVEYAKKILIEKACNWIKEHVMIPYEGKFDGSETPITDYLEWCENRLKESERIINEFKKAMEE